MTPPDIPYRNCLRDPIAEIGIAAAMLSDAVSADLEGRQHHARDLLRESNMDAVRSWTESLWGKNSRFAPRSKLDADQWDGLERLLA